jgi:MoaA/NifB/PqqE/SkfB family radical SAM enzyme
MREKLSQVSYTSADTVPIKMLVHQDTVIGMETGMLIPTHIQLVLTNQCNLMCPFCSYGKVDRKLSLTLPEVIRVLDNFKQLGSEAVTITGGGEPTLYPEFDRTVQAAVNMDYSVGLITNGTVLDRVDPRGLNQMVWSRVSCSDHWDCDKYQAGVRRAVEMAPVPDWGMSYVVGCGATFRIDNFVKCVRLANELGMKYVRVVSDLTYPEKATSMEVVRQVLAINDVDDSIVIYQGRKNTPAGHPRCWISLIKPYIGADGGIYPCCAVQYAKEELSFTTPKDMRMGTIEDIDDIWDEQKPFDGSKCVRCHYHQYNTTWNQLKQGIDHAEFI